MAKPDEHILQLTLLSRRDCPLCEELQLELEQWDNGRGRYQLNIVDIDTDAQLQERYGLRVPVLMRDEDELCAGRLSAAALVALDLPI